MPLSTGHLGFKQRNSDVFWRQFDEVSELLVKQLKKLARMKFGLERSYSESAGRMGVARSNIQTSRAGCGCSDFDCLR